MNPAAAIAECRKRHENARAGKRWGLFGGPAYKLNHGESQSLIGGIHDRVFREGRVVWGALVMANVALYSLGTRDSAAAVVYSFDPVFDDDPDELSHVASEVGALKDTAPHNFDLATFAAEVSNETAREVNCLVPRRLCGGREVRYETLYIQRARLPGGYLAGGLLPVVASESLPTQPMLLPLDLWAPDLIVHWQAMARHNPPMPPRSAPPASQDEFARLPLRITEAAAAVMHQLIRQEGLAAARLRVGYENGLYSMDLTDEAPDPNKDVTCLSHGITVLVERSAAGNLLGTEIDYRQTAEASGFVFNKYK